jgi:hypothetical protein
MKPQDIEKMIRYMAEGVETKDEIRFVETHLEGFNTFLLDMSTMKLVEAGIDREEAEAMLGCISQVSKMLGASNFNDYMMFNSITEGI